MGRNPWTSRDHTWKQKNQKSKTKYQCLFFWCEKKIFSNPQSYFFWRVCKQECYYIFTYIFLHVRKKVACSMEELHILWNCCQSLQLFKTYTRTQKKKHIEEVNKSCEREEEKSHLIVNWMTSLHKKQLTHIHKN